MYVMDRYPVKQPQNIIKVKVKHGTEKKKRVLEKIWMKNILLPLFLYVGQLVV